MKQALPPEVRVCFALKANGNPALVRSLGLVGCGADVSSLGELDVAERAGIPADATVFTGPAKTGAVLEALARRPIGWA